MLAGHWFEQIDGRSGFPFPLRFALHCECFLIFRFSVRNIDYSDLVTIFCHIKFLKTKINTLQQQFYTTVARFS